MKTEIEITVPKTIRFDGWHCMYDCDMLDGELICELFDCEVAQNKFKFDRLQACIKKYGDGDEK